MNCEKNARNDAVVWAMLALALVIGGCHGGASSSKSGGVAGKMSASVFEGPVAPLCPRIRYNLPPANGPLRVLTVEERIGVAQHGELVRVPVFFHEGECADPNGLAIFALADKKQEKPIPYQADDIRRDASGRISRMHLYFTVDLKGWERKQFQLVKGTNPGQDLAAVALGEQADRVTLAGEDLKVTFWSSGAKAGAIAGIESSLGKVSLPDGMLAPRLMLVRQSPDCKVTRSTAVSYADPAGMEVRDLRWASGPLFAKLIVRIGPKGLGDNAEFTYLVPRHGHEFIQSQRLFPDDPESGDVVGASENVLLSGRLLLGESAADQQVLKIPAGLRRLTRSVQPQSNAALVDAKSGISVFPIPYIQTGMAGIEAGQDATVSFVGTRNFKRTTDANSQTLRAFWGQVRFIFSRATDEEGLWQVSRLAFQPLTAVVDEPGLTIGDYNTELAVVMTTFDPFDWPQKTARLYTQRRTDEMEAMITQVPASLTSTDHWLVPARAAYAKLTAASTQPIRENQKGGPASGPLDPYMLTYGMSSIAPLAAFATSNPRLEQTCLAIGKAAREFKERVDEYGFPYIDCFFSAQNMQMGSYLMGIYAAKKSGDLDLLQFYRDCARTASVLCIYGHGQRAYTGRALGWGNSDLCYEEPVDLWMRTIELTCNEDLWQHPAVFGRYFDCVDVNADLYHRSLRTTDRGTGSWWRANMFRSQGHDHRWEAWTPFFGMHARASDNGAVGMTEAYYWARGLVGHWVNWPNLTELFFSDINLRQAMPQYRPEPAPPLPQDVRVKPTATGNVVTWQAVSGEKILGYRIYRAEKIGERLTFLNSPYTAKPGKLIEGTSYTDPDGKAGQVYFVTAVDAQRRESRWFPDEPVPEPGNKASR